jgi:hypothetical protein
LKSERDKKKNRTTNRARERKECKGKKKIITEKKKIENKVKRIPKQRKNKTRREFK